MTTAQDQQSRAEFEAKFGGEPYKLSVERTGRPHWPRGYREYQTQVAWEAWQAARVLPAGVTPDELKARCAEILQWQKTGILTGNALRNFAAEKYPGDAHALQMAEADTAREAYRVLAAAPRLPAVQGITHPTGD